jgi:glutaredoxin-related protein
MDRDDEEVIKHEDDEDDTDVEEFKESVDYIIGDIESELDDIDTSVSNINTFINNLKSLMSSFIASKDTENVIIPAVTEDSLDKEQVELLSQYNG